MITHMPEGSHAGRDFAAFECLTANGERLSKRLHNMYAKELFITGTDEDFVQAGAFFEESASDTDRTSEEVKEACLVAAAAANRAGDVKKFFKYAMKVIADNGCAEICCELGDFYMAEKDWQEAAIWYYNACYETEAILTLKSQGTETLKKLAVCYEKMGLPEEAALYRSQADELSRV